MMTGKLSKERLALLRTQAEAAANDSDNTCRTVYAIMLDLLSHIETMEGYQRAWDNRALNDAFELGHANAIFIEQQTARILELETQLATFAPIQAEMNRQDAKWGKQDHAATVWLAILIEEVGEVAKAIIERKADEGQKELVHVAAVAVQFIRALTIRGRL